MRVHTDLTLAEVRALPLPRGVTFYRLTEHGSRSRTRGIDLILEGTSNYGGQFGNQDYSAGTWDEWGDWLGELFRADPCARIAGVYEGAEDYHWATGDRFHPDADEPHNLCKRHRWDSVGGYRRDAIEYVHECTRKGCTAVKRYHRFRIGDQNPGGNAELINRPVQVFVPNVIPDRTAELRAARQAERRQAYVAPQETFDRLGLGALGERLHAANPELGKYASDGAYARDLARNPVDILDRIDDLIGE